MTQLNLGQAVLERIAAAFNRVRAAHERTDSATYFGSPAWRAGMVFPHASLPDVRCGVLRVTGYTVLFDGEWLKWLPVKLQACRSAAELASYLRNNANDLPLVRELAARITALERVAELAEQQAEEILLLSELMKAGGALAVSAAQRYAELAWGEAFADVVGMAARAFPEVRRLEKLCQAVVKETGHRRWLRRPNRVLKACTRGRRALRFCVQPTTEDRNPISWALEVAHQAYRAAVSADDVAAVVREELEQLLTGLRRIVEQSGGEERAEAMATLQEVAAL